MQGQQFLYFMTNEAGQFAHFQNGFLEWTAVATPLDFSPDGWMDLSILTERDKAYFGLNRTYGAPQSFVKDAAGILKTLFYQYSILEVVNLMIWEQKLYDDGSQYGYYYELLTKCEIDLSTFYHEGTGVTASILEGGIVKAMKANEGTIFEIPLDVDGAPNTLMDGINLYGTANYAMIPISFQTEGSHSGELPIVFLNKEGDQANILNQSGSSTHEFLPFVESVKGSNIVHIVGTLDWHVNTQAIAGLILLQKVKAGVYGAIIQTETLPTGDAVGVMNIDQIVTLDEGEGLLFSWVVSATAPHASPQLEFKQTNLTVTYTTRLAATLAKCIKPFNLFIQLVAKIMGVVDGSVYADSTLLKVLDPYILFSSGDALRTIPGCFLKTSLKEFFAFMDMRYDVGLGIVNGKLRMENKAFWANNTGSVTIDLGSAKDLKVTRATDFDFSEIKIGYPNKLDNAALGDINGRYEFCMTHVYTSPNNRSQNTLDLTCSYNAGMYVAENTRLNSIGKTTTDGNSDNDVFVLNVLPSPIPGGPTVIILPFIGPITVDLPSYYQLDRLYNSYVNGILEIATAFNVRLSPKQCLYAKGAYLRSCLTGMENKSIVFASADKDVNMFLIPPVGRKIFERTNVLVADLDLPYFKAVKFSFTTPPPDTFALLNPIRKFLFSYNNGTISLSGFDLKTGTQPADNREQSFDLLATADCDLTQLINVWE